MYEVARFVKDEEDKDEDVDVDVEADELVGQITRRIGKSFVHELTRRAVDIEDGEK